MRTMPSGISETRDANRATLDGKRAGVEADLSAKVSAAEASIPKAKNEALGKVDEIAADTAAALVAQLSGSVSPDQARAAVASGTREVNQLSEQLRDFVAQLRSVSSQFRV